MTDDSAAPTGRSDLVLGAAFGHDGLTILVRGAVPIVIGVATVVKGFLLGAHFWESTACWSQPRRVRHPDPGFAWGVPGHDRAVTGAVAF